MVNRDRRNFMLLLAGTAAAAAFLPQSSVLAQALPAPTLKPFEYNLGNAIGRYTGRIESLGVAANDNEVRRTLAQRLSVLGGRAAPFLRAAGRILGPVHLALTLYDLSKTISTDGTKAEVTSLNPASGGIPGTYAALADSMARGEVRTYTESGRTFWETHEPAGVTRPSSYYGPSWQRQFSRNQPGYGEYIWERVGSVPFTGYVPPTRPLEEVVGELEPHRNQPLRPQDVVALVNELLADGHSASPAKVPDPRAHPFTAADLGNDLWRLGDLLDLSAPDRDVALGEEPVTGGEPETPGQIDWGVFTPPALPAVPEPSEFFHRWFDPLNAVKPMVPPHTSACPVVEFNWLNGSKASFAAHCDVADTIRPTLRAGTAIAAALAAFWHIVSA